MSEHVGVHSEIEKETRKKRTVERKGRNSERSVKHKTEKVKGDKVGSTERESETEGGKRITVSHRLLE